jgi:hypothetical protein
MRKFSRNHLIVLILLTGFIALFLPQAAHADNWFTNWLVGTVAKSAGITGNDGFGSVLLRTLISLLDLVQALLVKVIVWLGQAMSWIIQIKPDGGGAVVYAAWKILRDFCNMAFIVVIILTSFGTIFNTFQFEWLKPYNIYNKKLLGGFIAAAIFMNFSLSIGQAAVALSNKVTDVMIGILPPNTGDQIAGSLKIAQMVGTGKMPLANLGAQPNVANSGPIQMTGATTVEAKTMANRAWQTIFEGSYLICMRDDGMHEIAEDSCGEWARNHTSRLPYPGVATQDQLDWSRNTGSEPCVELVNDTWAICDDAESAAQAVASLPSTDTALLAGQATGTIYSIFLLLTLALSFLAVVIFMLIRIPLVWVILVLSPLAWIGLIFPGVDWWDKWWKQFTAWNIFSPLYLFMIYFGLYMLNQQGYLLSSLGQQGTFNAQVGIFLFYLMTAIIFVLGSAAVVKVAFAGGGVAGTVFGKISGRLGITGTTGAAGAVYRGLGLQTEIESRTRGLAAGLGTIKERVPFLSEGRRQGRAEELERRYKARFGTSEAKEADTRKKVTEIMKKNAEEGLSVENMKAKFKKLADAKTFNAEYFALSKSLLKEGELTPEQIKTLAKTSTALGATGQSLVRQEIARKLGEQAKEKKYRDFTTAGEALDALSTDQERKKFLSELKRNQIIEYALLTGNRKLAYIEEDTGKEASQILEQNSASIDAEEAAKVIALAETGATEMGPNVEYRIKDLAGNAGNVAKMRDAAARIKPGPAGTRSASESVEELIKKVKESKKPKT